MEGGWAGCNLVDTSTILVGYVHCTSEKDVGCVCWVDGGCSWRWVGHTSLSSFDATTSGIILPFSHTIRRYIRKSYNHLQMWEKKQYFWLWKVFFCQLGICHRWEEEEEFSPFVVASFFLLPPPPGLDRRGEREDKCFPICQRKPLEEKWLRGGEERGDKKKVSGGEEGGRNCNADDRERRKPHIMSRVARYY